MLKYPFIYSGGDKFGCFQSEKEHLKTIAEEVGLIETGKYQYCRHPLAYLTEAADDICYRILDLEDAYEMNILSFHEVQSAFAPLCEDNDSYKEVMNSEDISCNRKLSYMRTKTIRHSVDAVVDTFVNNYDAIMSGEFDGELINNCPTKIKQPLNIIKEIGRNKVFNELRKVELEIGCYTAIGLLLDALCQAAYEATNDELTYKSKRVLCLLKKSAPVKGDSLYESILRVLDYISGMTDNYASYMAKQIGGMGH